MLISLQIRDFAIVDQIAVEFDPGMTVLTGETGAGKSILVDAVGLVLGERGGSQLVRGGAKRAEFSAEFDVSALPEVRDWLEAQALDQDGACLLRRVIGADGRSRAFINGNAVTVQQLKSLGELLLDIHGQHFHQSLGRRPVQRDLLDYFGELQDTRRQTEASFEKWQLLQERLDKLRAADADQASRLDLLEFQLQELVALDVKEGELESLQAERQKLRNSGTLADGVATALSSLSEDDARNASSLLAEAARSVASLVEYDNELEPVCELLDSATIQIAEATDALQRYGDTIDMDPARRDWVEDRLDAMQSVARKHRVTAEELRPLSDKLRAEHDELSHAEERGRELEEQVTQTSTAYRKLAATLSRERKKAAKDFSAAVTEAMAGLGMPGGVFEVHVSALPESAARPWGVDDIDFLISANPGQPPMPLSRVASGGELSRMSLAIQVIASDGSAIPTMVFDEVDSGIGGRVAEMVGRRLRELGANRQVLCVTHLPQVASLADQHFRISKVTDGKATRTGVSVLGKEERIEELARMLGGVEITQKTIEHAAEMLAGAARKRA
ncbi:MAG: DNA repair protein RecN [Gammaproteobacteria bacterium]|nr:DNA repair protein RecN [Gammaproteobacteria bacterium]MDH3750053.1 DNA repair protein RecN [Gammaproteobacteria bacterium]MDH3805083.1 DNA repair protein RecN [Gammaproteobacteria bacterium]